MSSTIDPKDIRNNLKSQKNPSNHEKNEVNKNRLEFAYGANLNCRDQSIVTFNHLHLVINEDIINCNEVRNKLKQLDYLFDTDAVGELVIKAFHAWGLDSVKYFMGSFAIAIYDEENNRFLLCRDRVGINPMYYFHSDGEFMFAFGLKVFLEMTSFKKDIELEYLHEFLKVGYVSNNNTLVKGVKKIEPGTWIEFDLDTYNLQKHSFWQIRSFYQQQKFSGSFESAVSKSHDLLLASCERNLQNSTTIGAFLSGGFDSSLISSILKNDFSQQIEAFTIGFPDGVDESADAIRIAKHLGINHTVYNCTTENAKELIPLLPEYYDEPNGDISCIPTVLAFKIANQEVQTIFGGDGSDEIFGGYGHYASHVKYLNKLEKIPLKSIIRYAAKGIYPFLKNKKPRLAKGTQILSEVLRYPDNRRYHALTSVINGVPNSIISPLFVQEVKSEIELILFENIVEENDAIYILDYEQSMQNLFTPKVERASSAYSLKLRVPYLDHELIEFASQLPYDFKHDGLHSKRIIREITYKYIPKEIMDRPKTGFNLPIFGWLKTDLKFLIEEYLSESAINHSRIFDPREIKKITTLFFEGKLYYQNVLWHLIVFQMWYSKWIKK